MQPSLEAQGIVDGDGLALRAERLTCTRGGRRLFRDLSFELRPGQAVELRGANGSGKSSLLRAMAGLLPLELGSVDWQGGLAYLGHQNGLAPDLTGRENLSMALRIGGANRTAAAAQATAALMADALSRLGLDATADLPVRRLSQGQRRRLALARVLLSGQALWLLDEPDAALDDDGQHRFHALLARHLSTGGLAVVATHHPLELPPAACVRLDLDHWPRRRHDHALAA